MSTVALPALPALPASPPLGPAGSSAPHPRPGEPGGFAKALQQAGSKPQEGVQEGAREGAQKGAQKGAQRGTNGTAQEGADTTDSVAEKSAERGPNKRARAESAQAAPAESGAPPLPPPPLPEHSALLGWLADAGLAGTAIDLAAAGAEGAQDAKVAPAGAVAGSALAMAGLDPPDAKLDTRAGGADATRALQAASDLKATPAPASVADLPAAGRAFADTEVSEPIGALPGPVSTTPAPGHSGAGGDAAGRSPDPTLTLLTASDATATPAPAAAADLPASLPSLPAGTAGGGVAGPIAPSPAAGAEAVRLAPPLHSPAFAPALGAQLSLMVRDGLSEARLHLNPAEMGPVSVRISIEGASARVDLVADQAPTRQVLEQAMPVLAGALRESGLTLTGGGVFEQPRDARQPGPDGGAHPGAAADGDADADPSLGGGVALPGDPLRGASRLRGVVDLYA